MENGNMNWMKKLMNSTPKVVSTLKTNEYIAPKNTELDDVIRQWVAKK
jgi:hypothetical protein